MRVRELMSSDVEIVQPDIPVREAAERMRTFAVGSLVVSHAFDLHGVVTDRDLVVRVMAPGLDPDTTPVSAIMSMEPVFCYEDDEVGIAADIMERHAVRRLAVLRREDSRLAGILSLVDIAIGADDPTLTASILPKVSGPR